MIENTKVRNQVNIMYMLRYLSAILPILILFGVWELASGTIVPSALLPPFSETFDQAIQLWHSEELQPYLLDTLYRGFMGIIIAIGLGVSIGLAMAQNDLINRILNPIVSLTYPSPKSPLIPIVIFWLGIGNLSRIVLAVIGALLPIVISTINGADNVPKELLWSAETMGLNKLQRTVKVVLPSALPSILTGVRIGLIFSFVIVISSEMITARTGIGVLIVDFGQIGDYTGVFAAVLWSIAIVASIDRIFIMSSSRLLRWSDQDVGGI